jgi:hypothetical protein
MLKTSNIAISLDNTKKMTTNKVDKNVDFIEAVRKEPCLWDLKSDEYKLKSKKYDAWKKLTDDFGLAGGIL